MNTFTKIAVVIGNIGAINWGLKAINEKAELVQYLQVNWLITTVYAIVGLAGLYCLIKLIMNK
jgi:uncharacterized membrane protein YuzA (DUF378 family)